MRLDDACAYVLTEGPHRGTLADIGSTEEGLLHLDRRRWRCESAAELLALQTDLGQDAIRDDLERLAAERG